MTQSTILSPRPHLGTEPRAHESTAPGRSLSLSLLPSLLSSHPLLRFAFLSPPRVRPTETYSSWRTKQRPPPSPSEDRSTDYPFPRKPGASQSLAHHPAKGLRNLGKKVKMLKMKEMQEILVPTASPGPRSHSFRSNPKKSASYWGLARGPSASRSSQEESIKSRAKGPSFKTKAFALFSAHRRRRRRQ